MRFAFSDEQQALIDSARKFLSRRATPERVRELMQTEAGYDPQDWQVVAAELGWAAAAIPEDFGGFGLGTVEVVGLMEVMGRHLAPLPFLSTVCMGVPALLEGGTAAQKTRWLPAIAEAQATVAVALDPVVSADGHLSGTTKAVDGGTADLLIVRSQEGWWATEGGTAERLSSMDETRRWASITFEDTPAEPMAPLSRALDLGRVALAAECVGVAEASLEMAVEYAKVREQFGRAIGSFQAVKHICADMLVKLESARSAVWWAGWAAESGEDPLPVVAALALSEASEAAWSCAAENIQVHGGIGFTWECDAHLYFKRARASRTLLGASSAHYDTIAGSLGL